MAKYVIEDSTLKGLADALRKVTGETRTYTPTEMIDAVSTILESGTYILVDENGTEIPAVFVENETTFTAGPNDVRIGTTAVGNNGVFTGEKEIPSYNTSEGIKLVPTGTTCVLPIPNYEYTKLQAIFCPFNTCLTDSVSAEKVAIEDSVYSVRSTIAETGVVKDTTNEWVDFCIVNTADTPLLIRYFTYKEIY